MKTINKLFYTGILTAISLGPVNATINTNLDDEAITGQFVVQNIKRQSQNTRIHRVFIEDSKNNNIYAVFNVKQKSRRAMTLKLMKKANVTFINQLHGRAVQFKVRGLSTYFKGCDKFAGTHRLVDIESINKEEKKQSTSVEKVDKEYADKLSTHEDKSYLSIFEEEDEQSTFEDEYKTDLSIFEEDDEYYTPTIDLSIFENSDEYYIPIFDLSVFSEGDVDVDVDLDEYYLPIFVDEGDDKVEQLSHKDEEKDEQLMHKDDSFVIIDQKVTNLIPPRGCHTKAGKAASKLIGENLVKSFGRFLGYKY